MSHTGPVHEPRDLIARLNSKARRRKIRKGATRFPGLLQRHIDAKRKRRFVDTGKSYQPIPPLSTKYRRIKYSDGSIYEKRPDGWRFVGFKA